MSLWDHLGNNPEEGNRFSEGMRQLTAVDLKALSRSYPWPKSGAICDFGGGTGGFLASILAHRPRARGMLVEAGEVLSAADHNLRELGIRGRVDLVQGDLREPCPVTADLYIVKWILHNWDDDTCVEILKAVMSSMHSGARIVAIDQHLERRRPNVATSLVDLHVLVACEGGRERSPSEVLGLMVQAGLKPGRVRHAGIHMIVEGIAP